MSEPPKEPEYGESDSDTDSQAADPDISAAAYSTLLPPSEADNLQGPPSTPSGPGRLDELLSRPYKRHTTRRKALTTEDINFEVFSVHSSLFTLSFRLNTF